METYKNTHPSGPGEKQIFINKAMIFPAILRNWYWFILAAALGLTLALGFNKYFHGSYKSSMTLLLKNVPHQSTLNSTMDNLDIKEKTVNIQDEQSVVSAYSLQLKTLQDLDWKTSVYKKLIIGKQDLYKNEPFVVTLSTGKEQAREVPVTIHILPGGDYTAQCDYQSKTADSLVGIKFSEKGAFGKPFDNTWFHFTLDPAVPGSVPEAGIDYLLVINNIAGLAIDYQGQLAVKIAAPESNVLTVELKGPNVQRNVDYLNGLGETYRKFGLDQKNQSAINTMQFIRNQIAGVADSLQLSSNRFTNFKTNNKVVDLSQEGTLILQKAEEVDKKVNTLKLKINYYNELNNHLNSEDDLKSFVAPSIGDPDPELVNLVQKQAQQYSVRKTLSLTAQARNPKLIEVNNDIELTQQLIKKTVGSLLSNAQFELNSLEQQKAQTNTRLTAIPQTERAFMDVKRGFDINSQLYNFLLQKRAEAGIALASNNPDAQILDAATPMTTEPIGLKPIVNLAIGILLGIVLTLGIILLRLYTDKKLKDQEGVRQSLHLSVAGSIYHNKTGSELPVLQYPNSEITEAFRDLRANLRLLLKDRPTAQPGAILAVHSVSRAEGKSFIAANISAILSLSGKKVLLLDLDKKTPRPESLGSTPAIKSLGHYLNGKASLTEILSDTQVPGLSFIKAGNPDTRLAELMDSPQMDKFMKEAQAFFDFIVIDNSPIGILSDAKTIASYADINLFVLRIGFSTRKNLGYINRTAEEETVPNMVVVLNDVPAGRGQQKKEGYFNESVS
ncbi:GumC family protein [Flavitalea flava]